MFFFKYDETPKPGDLIEVFRVGYQHWAVYVGDGFVVHKAPPCKSARHTHSLTFLSGTAASGLFRPEYQLGFFDYALRSDYYALFPKTPQNMYNTYNTYQTSPFVYHYKNTICCNMWCKNLNTGFLPSSRVIDSRGCGHGCQQHDVAHL